MSGVCTDRAGKPSAGFVEPEVATMKKIIANYKQRKWRHRGCLYRTTDYTWAACEAYYGPCDAGEAWRSRITSAQLGSIMIRTVDGRRTSGNYKCFLCINRHFIDIWFFDFRYGNLVGPACGGGNVRTARPVSSDVARNGARRRDTRLKRGPSRASRDACKLGTAQMQMAAFLFNGWKQIVLIPNRSNSAHFLAIIPYSLASLSVCKQHRLVG